jgi:hypothetical protein
MVANRTGQDMLQAGARTMPGDPTDSPLWPADNPAVTTHINMLQGIINRLANNSGACKTWCLVLVGALLSLAGATHLPAIVTFALVPVVIFGLLDGMYLAHERAYRTLYNQQVIAIRTRKYILENAYEARAPVGFGDFLSALTSWSVCPIYAGLIVVYLTAEYRGWLAVLAVVAKSG